MKLSQEDINAILRLKQDDDFNRFMGAVGVMAEEYTHRLIYCDPDKLDLTQGMTRGIVEIIKLVAETKPQP